MQTLHNGDQMSMLGLSTSLHNPQSPVVPPEEVWSYAVLRAVNMGYRHIDTSQVDHNLKTIGVALKKLKEEGEVKREDLFITSKVWNTHHSRQKCHEAVDSILEDLQLDYVDLMLIHWPQGFNENNVTPDENGSDEVSRISKFFPTDSDGNILNSDIDFLETWKALEEAVRLGKIRSIGLANFSEEQTKQVWDFSEIKPAVVQIPVTPFQAQVELRKYCSEKGIVVVSPYPDKLHQFTHQLKENRVVMEVAKQVKLKPVLVILRWFIDNEITVLRSPHRKTNLENNLQIFDFKLTREQIDRISSLDGKYPEVVEKDWNIWKPIFHTPEEDLIRYVPTVTLNTDNEMPMLGITTWRDFRKLNQLGWDIENVPLSLESALKNGFRHIDCGQVNLNLTQIKKAISRSKIKNREELFITAKVSNTCHSFNGCRKAVDTTIEDLRSDYIDLMLIEWPQGFVENHEAVITDDKDVDYVELCEFFPNDGEKFIVSEIDYLETWRALEKAFEEGKVRSIGVANFTEKELKRVWNSAKVKPAVVQIEVTPYLIQTDIRKFCHENNIIVSSVVISDDAEFLKDPVILRISEETEKTPFQVYLRWLHENNIVVLYKAYDEIQQKSNMEIFEFSLSEKQLKDINNMKREDAVVSNLEPFWPFLDDKVIQTRPILISKKNGIPCIGVTTWSDRFNLMLARNQIEKVVNLDYRHIDCGHTPPNQLEVGNFVKAVKKVKRKHLFLSAQMLPFQESPNDYRHKIRNILRNLNVNYVDLLYLRWPQKSDSRRLPKNFMDYLEVWRVLSEGVRGSKVNMIGVCNFNKEQIESILVSRIEIKPSVVKVEMNPYFIQKELRDFCKKKGIVVVGYSPFGRNVLNDPTIRTISQQIGKTPAQTIVRWFIEHDVIVMPSFSNENELINALDFFSFSLSEKQISLIDGLDKSTMEDFDSGLVAQKVSNGLSQLAASWAKFRIKQSIQYPFTWSFDKGYTAKDLIFHGCRHIDFACVDMDLKDLSFHVINSLKDGIAKREDMFLSFKLWNTCHSKEYCLRSIHRTLTLFRTDYIDLVIIHWPQGYEEGGKLYPENYSNVDYLETWKTLESAVKDGMIRSIGLCNFNSSQIQRVWDSAEIKPAVVQMEMNPYLNQEKLRNFCEDKGIVVSSYAPFGGNRRSKNEDLCMDPVIQSICREVQKSPEQVILRWCIQHRVVPLPKFYSIDEFHDTMKISKFELSVEQMKMIDELNQGLRTWNNNIRDEDHQYWPFHDEF